jgi:histidinol dehydrogenase
VFETLDLRERGGRLEPSKLEIDPAVSEIVRGILQRVFVEGDDVLIELALKFDGADLRETGVLVTPAEFADAEGSVPGRLKAAIDDLVVRLEDLATRQLPREWWDERDGVRFGEIVRPLESVGCYVPGGRAVYPSSVCMTVVPAVVAGVEEIVLTTPPQPDGSIPAAVLYAAARAGATKVVKSGGAQAIGALTYGSESVPTVDRIVGPGNVYVTEAKRQVAGFVGIDGLAGPSELAIVADGDVDPHLAALDLIAQAEHDPEARTFFISPDADLIERIGAALGEALAKAGRREIVDAAMAHTKAVIVRDLDHAAEAANDVAAEHLQILLDDPVAFVPKIRNAGAVFLGHWTAVPFGDYGVASNHVLPTAGTARFTSGLRSADYVTVSSVVLMDGEAAARFAPGTSAIAVAEGLVGHARAMDTRAERATGVPMPTWREREAADER